MFILNALHSFVGFLVVMSGWVAQQRQHSYLKTLFEFVELVIHTGLRTDKRQTSDMSHNRVHRPKPTPFRRDRFEVFDIPTEGSTLHCPWGPRNVFTRRVNKGMIRIRTWISFTDLSSLVTLDWWKPNVRIRICDPSMRFTNQIRLLLVELRLESQTLCLKVLCLLLENLEMISKETETRLWCRHPPRDPEFHSELSWA